MVGLSATFRLLWHCIPKSRFCFTFIRILLLALAILPLCWQYFRVIVTCQTSIQSHSFVKLPPRNCFILFVTDWMWNFKFSFCFNFKSCFKNRSQAAVLCYRTCKPAYIGWLNSTDMTASQKTTICRFFRYFRCIGIKRVHGSPARHLKLKGRNWCKSVASLSPSCSE